MSESKPSQVVSIECDSEHDARELADRIIKSGVLKEGQKIKVYLSVYDIV